MNKKLKIVIVVIAIMLSFAMISYVLIGSNSVSSVGVASKSTSNTSAGGNSGSGSSSGTSGTSDSSGTGTDPEVEDLSSYIVFNNVDYAQGSGFWTFSASFDGELSIHSDYLVGFCFYNELQGLEYNFYQTDYSVDQNGYSYEMHIPASEFSQVGNTGSFFAFCLEVNLHDDFVAPSSGNYFTDDSKFDVLGSSHSDPISVVAILTRIKPGSGAVIMNIEDLY